MLTTKLIHPEIMAAVSKCGHGDKILIADGNYPIMQRSGDAVKIYLGLSAGKPTVTDVLEALLGVIHVEKAEVMTPGDGSVPPIFEEFRQMMPDIPMEEYDRYAFYDQCSGKNAVLAISTGEQRIFSNLLLTVGCP